MDFEIHEAATSTLILPTLPVTATLFDQIGVQPLDGLAVAIVEADAGFTPELLLTLDAAPSFGGEAGQFVLSWTDPAPFDATELAFSVDLSQADGLVPMLYPPDPVYGPEGIVLSFPTMMRQGPDGPVVGTSETWLTIDPGPLQAEGAITFDNVLVTPQTAPDGDSMTSFTLSFTLVPGAAGVETIWPLLEMTWWSDWTPIDVTSVPASAAEPAEMRLTAAPSVTRTGTHLRVARPFDAARRLLVHDVVGRRVAELTATAGTRSVYWDGRNRSGRLVPPGVYFVNVVGERGDATRVVKLR